MKMVGNIGQPRSVPGVPKLAEIGGVLNLMNTLGSKNDEVRQLLIDLKEAIAFNEALLADVRHDLAQLGDLQKREHELAEVEARSDKKLAEIAAIRENWGAYRTDLKAGRYG